ncbi:MAG: hypothetical protein AAB466_12840 [Verrucomicrobiota bacterium]
MSFRRYEIILPTRHNDGSPVQEENHLWVGEQLAAQFGAYTFEPQPLRGVWTLQGVRYEEDNLRVFVDVEDTPENADFFGQLKPRLKERFRQIDIWIVSYEIRIT